MSLATAVASAALMVGAAVPSPCDTQARPKQIAAIDSVVADEMRTSKIPGVAVAVVENGRVAVRRAYGIANLETETRLDTNSVFHLASITKQFTAAGIMMLVEEGKVRLDDPVSAYVANTPPAWEKITLRHLLTHTSGLDISAIPRIQGTPLLNITTAHVFEFVSKQPLRFPTGEHGWYSDAGYFLLGMVIEKASGQSYRDFLQKRMFGPLRMTNSSVTDRRRILKRRVSTYSLIGGELVNWRRDWDYELPAMAGIWSTLDDLAAWDASLRGATLLKPSSLEQMWTPARLTNGQFARVLEQSYGFGFELANLRGHRTVGHGGASGPYILRFVDEPLTIIVLTNLDTESGRHPVVLARAVAGAYRPQYRPPHSLAAEPDPDPSATKAAETFLADISARRESPTMSDAYRAWYATAIGPRAFMRSQLDGLTKLTYLGRDDLGGRSIWEGEPLDRLVHYSGKAKERTIYLTLGLTKDGRIAKVDYYGR